MCAFWSIFSGHLLVANVSSGGQRRLFCVSAGRSCNHLGNVVPRFRKKYQTAVTHIIWVSLVIKTGFNHETVFFSFWTFQGGISVAVSLRFLHSGPEVIRLFSCSKMVREQSRECHNHKPQPFPDTKRKRKPTYLNKHKSNKRTKSTKISSLFPKRGNRNTKRTEKHKNKMTHGKTYNKSPRRINHKATKSKTNTWTTALKRSVEQTTRGGGGGGWRWGV